MATNAHVQSAEHHDDADAFDDPDAVWLTYDWSAVTRDAVVASRAVRYVDVGSGPTVILIHGQGGCWQWWLRVIPSLARTSRVVAVDLAGFGASEVAVGDAFYAQSAIVLSLLDQLGESTATVVGHSMGGLVALAVAADHPERVAGLVLVNGGAVPVARRRLGLILVGMRLAHAALSQPRICRWIATTVWAHRRFFASGVVDPASVSSALAAILVPAMGAPGFVATMRAAVRARDEINPARVKCPALVVWGARDRILTVGMARSLVAQMSGAELVVFDDVGHCPMIEAPTQLAAELRRFTGAPRDNESSRLDAP
jgi:pimeloyl-ACP methyl ester carboxylesterase